MIIPIILLALVYYLFLFRHFLFGSPSRHLPPSPNIFHILLNFSKLINKPHVAFNNLSKIYGPLISLRVGGQLFVVASSPSVAKEIHKTHNRIFSGRYLPSIFYNVPGTAESSIMMSKECNDTWKSLKYLSQNNFFSAKAVESSADVRKSKVMEMVRLLSVEKMGQVVNVEEMIFAAFINVMSNRLISRDLFETGGDGESDEMARVFVNDVIDKCSIFGLSDVFPSLKGIDFWTKRRAMDMLKGIKLIWGDIIDERRRKRNVDHNSEPDFLDDLLGSTFPDNQILILISELLIGATDSTTITCVWLMTELIKNQEILHKVRKEIAENAVEGDSLNETRLPACQYFQACIKEILRLHVPGPLALPHRAIETCKVDNYVIPKDSIVFVNSWAIQLDPNHWEDPHSFKPERFLGSKVDYMGNHFEYIPFSSGQRMCPGKSLGIASVELMVASLIHYLEWSLPNGADRSKLDTSDRFGTTLKKEKPLLLIPIPRHIM